LKRVEIGGLGRMQYTSARFVYVERGMRLKTKQAVLEDKASRPNPEGLDRLLDTKDLTFQAVKSEFLNVKPWRLP